MNDDRLGQLFQALRRHDAGLRPPFADTLAAARRRRPTRRGAVVAALAAAAALVLLAVIWGGPSRHQGIVDLATARWEAPTDFLLQTPGAQLLRTVPALGRLTDVTTTNLQGRMPQ